VTFHDDEAPTLLEDELSVHDSHADEEGLESSHYEADDVKDELMASEDEGMVYRAQEWDYFTVTTRPWLRDHGWVVTL